MTTKIALPGKVSGQNILDALKYATNPPTRAGRRAKLKWEQEGSSSTFQLLERELNPEFRPRRGISRHLLHIVEGTSMEVQHGSLPVDINREYEGEVSLILRIRDNRLSSKITAPYLRVTELFAKRLADRMINNRSSSADETDRISA